MTSNEYLLYTLSVQLLINKTAIGMSKLIKASAFHDILITCPFMRTHNKVQTRVDISNAVIVKSNKHKIKGRFNTGEINLDLEGS